MQKKIVILSSGHSPFDERIFWKLGRTFTKNNFEVIISTSTESLNVQKDNIVIDSFDAKDMNKKEKINKFISILNNHKPDLIICSEPLPIIAASEYRKKVNNKTIIISDITEWYPGPNTLSQYSGINKNVQYLKHFLFNAYATNLADHLIIGEENKAKLYNYIAPSKKKTIIGYYPPVEYFKYYPSEFNGKDFTLCFTGLFTKERGFMRFIELGKSIARKCPNINFHLLLIGRYMSLQDKEILNDINNISNLSIIEKSWTSFDKFNSLIGSCDICIDLRDKNYYFDNALPIKIFDYIATGKPVIYSDISSLKQIPELSTFGYVLNPDNINEAVDIILSYIKSPEKLKEHSLNARRVFEEKYNWEKLEPVLLTLINKLLS